MNEDITTYWDTFMGLIFEYAPSVLKAIAVLVIGFWIIKRVVGLAKATMKAPMATVQADAKVEVKAPMAFVTGAGMLKLKGGIVMIN